MPPCILPCYITIVACMNACLHTHIDLRTPSSPCPCLLGIVCLVRVEPFVHYLALCDSSAMGVVCWTGNTTSLVYCLFDCADNCFLNLVHLKPLYDCRCRPL